MKTLYVLLVLTLIAQCLSTKCGDAPLPTKAEDCKDSNEICCYIELTKKSETVKFCFPAPDKMDQSDVDKEVNQYTGYTVESLTCFDFSQNLKYAIGNLILIGLILF